MLLYIIRHADPIYDPDSLTKKGLRQAEAVGRRLATRHFDRIYSSPMIRAQQTAQPLSELTGLPVQIEEWASEALAWNDLSCAGPDGRHGWSFALASRTAMRREESLRIGDDWHTLPEFSQINGKAGYQRIIDASDDFLSRQGYVREGRVYRAERPNDERVALFCHQGFGITWISHLLQIPPHIMWTSFDITHSGVTIIRFANQPDGYSVPQCLCLSDISHIYGENLPMMYVNEIEI